MNVPLQIIYKTSSVGRWTVEIHSYSHKSPAHEIKLSEYSIPSSHCFYKDRDFEVLLQRTKTKQPKTRHWKGTCIWSENCKGAFSWNVRMVILVTIGCFKNGRPPLNKFTNYFVNMDFKRPPYPILPFLMDAKVQSHWRCRSWTFHAGGHHWKWGAKRFFFHHWM